MSVKIEYGSRTALTNNSPTDLDGRSSGSLTGFGRIVNTATDGDGKLDYHIHLAMPIATGATDGGVFRVYLVESQNGTEWTDGISPTATSDQTAKLQNAKLIRTYNAGGTGSGTTTLRDHFNVAGYVVNMPQYVGFLFKNSSGQTATNGFDADYQSITFATA